MAATRKELVYSAVHKVETLTDLNTYNDLTKRYEYRKQTMLDDESLTTEEKMEAIEILTKNYDHSKILLNEGIKRFCEKCQQECLATSYCEHCIRIYLKSKFSDWTSGNNDVDKLIQECQMESFRPDKIIEWIPYNKLQGIKLLTRGGFSEIYSANWIDGRYSEWDSNEQQLKRLGLHNVILKQLQNVEHADRSWFEEAKSHLTIGNKQIEIVRCFGLTRGPLDGNYMLVTRFMDMNLREYLSLYYNFLTWKEKIKIVYYIINALHKIHSRNAIHRDLHSGNVLYLKRCNDWYISDLGFCGPVNKPLKSIYGNLPYIAPDVLIGRAYTFESEIYSIGILMWEISSGQLPFKNHEYSYDLAMNIVNGMRPKIISGTPSEYKELMKQCWDANPLNRPKIEILLKKIKEMRKVSYINTEEFDTLENNDSIDSSQILQTNLNSSSTLCLLSTSELYQFENLPEPRNATEEEQEAFHSKPYNFSIPNNNEFV